MPRARRALLLALSLTLAGCTPGAARSAPFASHPASSTAGGAVSGGSAAGGSASGWEVAGPHASGSATAAGPDGVSLLATEAIGTLDPQRISGHDLAAFAGRTVTRTLTAYTTSSGSASGSGSPSGSASSAGPTNGSGSPSGSGPPTSRLAGDLATGTGTPSEGGRRWTFTLRAGLAWDDGSALTCADVAYGISRAFAPEVAGGVSYPVAYLDIPHRHDGSSTYRGPYASGPAARAGAAAYKKAVACDRADRTVTFTLAHPLADFDAMVSLPAFAPFPKERDPGPGAKPVVVSSGPYLVAGEWSLSRAGLALVPNPEWAGANDPIRPKPLSRIDIRQHMQLSEVIGAVAAANRAHRLIAWDPAPPAVFEALTGAGKRVATVNPRTQVVDYLLPSFVSPVMHRAHMRRALGLATDRAAYVRGIGGANAAEPALTILSRGISLSSAADVTPADPAAALAVLADAGARVPVPIVVAYRAGELANKGMNALKSGWEAGGFSVTLAPMPRDYAGAGEGDADVYWGQWGPDYPSAAAVLPPLFDASLAPGPGAASGPGSGTYSDSGTTARMALASREPDPAKRAAAWRAIDNGLRREGAYIGLAARRSLYLGSPGLGADWGNELLGGVIDLSAIGRA